MKKLVVFFTLILIEIGAALPSKEVHLSAPIQWVSFNPEYSYDMMNQNDYVTEKAHYLLNAKEKFYSRAVIGTQARFIGSFGWTNTKNKFPYLMRLPSDFHGRTASELNVNNFNIAITAAVTNWLTLYGEIRYNPARTFGPGNEDITVFDAQGNPLTIDLGSVRDTTRQLMFGYNAFALVGNPNYSGFYFYIGHFTLPFGNFKTYNPFSQSVPFHYFAARGNGASLGYQYEGFNIEFCGVQGGPQERVANGGNDGKVGNFTVNAKYDNTFRDFLSLHLGGGMIFGTGYCSKWPISHFVICDKRNGAWDVNAELGFGKHFSVRGELVRTFKVWPGTSGTPSQPKFFFPAKHLTTFVVESKYEFDIYKKRDENGNITKTIPFALTASWGEGLQGDRRSPWAFNKQFTAAIQSKLTPTVLTFLEYNFLRGFAPLQWMSGFYSAPGVFVMSSNKYVRENLFLGGITAAF
ncbi:MAG: hypothetical protein KDK76_00100 [Chlamydiia bacterium]|nr:hypothetical protein [Chlamydiia bacterium]